MRLFQNQAEEWYFEIFVFVTPLQVCHANKQEDVKTISSNTLRVFVADNVN